ncbi:DedA family protein [Flavobacterium capsici]|uniref:VTT domain-containing protein n=1 Tax=Flavobacterium capsici TaxID=3075618 RepID=A0AA96J3D3_9FLAO|nr:MULTISPECIES: VTT domain-containing protein [unclassified Flavobacterium]WNM19158.1 VTT domain-containing protein [Flavobacterium sp. PMR2A8]WNM20547.1 VTT domain-containing protein [Flavobacterium sp. PMTSA4]
MDTSEWIKLLNPEFYINMSVGGVQVGLWIVLFIVFAETGLFAGFFLPGDSLLFLSGIYACKYTDLKGIEHPGLIDQFYNFDNEFTSVLILASLVAIAGIIGNMVGYWFGSKSGYYLYKKEDSFWFKKKYLIQSKDFFEKYGGKAIIFARFLPIFRTFAPIVAGIVAMDKKKFMFYNVVSSFLWSFVLIFSGHYLYGLFLEKFNVDLKHHIEKIIIAIILVSTVPVLLKMFKKEKKAV